MMSLVKPATIDWNARLRLIESLPSLEYVFLGIQSSFDESHHDFILKLPELKKNAENESTKRAIEILATAVLAEAKDDFAWATGEDETESAHIAALLEVGADPLFAPTADGCSLHNNLSSDGITNQILSAVVARGQNINILTEPLLFEQVSPRNISPQDIDKPDRHSFNFIHRALWTRVTENALQTLFDNGLEISPEDAKDFFLGVADYMGDIEENYGSLQFTNSISFACSSVILRPIDVFSLVARHTKIDLNAIRRDGNTLAHLMIESVAAEGRFEEFDSAIGLICALSTI
jgi:hypothetical protein